MPQSNLASSYSQTVDAIQQNIDVMGRRVKYSDASHHDLRMIDATTASLATRAAPNSRNSGLYKHALNSNIGR